jgi:hypothetical protein
MGFRDVWQEGDGISLPTLKFEQMVSSRQLVRRSDGMYEANLDRKVAAFDGFETFFDERGPYSARPNDERVIVTRCETPIQSVKAVATAALSIPEHPRARWRERVVALGLAQDDSDAEMLAWLRRASPRLEVAEQRADIAYFRAAAPAPAEWIEFVVALDGTGKPTRIVTIATAQSQAERLPPAELEQMSRDRRARAQAVTIEALAEGRWRAHDPDGAHWEVTARPGDSYACSCPDFRYKSGRAGIACKHIEAVRAATTR